MKIQQNAYTSNLTENEFVAVNPAGTPIGRASSHEALEKAHPDGSATILTAAEVNAAEPTLAEAVVATLEGPFAAVVAQGVAPEAKPELPPDADKKAPIKADPLDHDEDGKKGGNVLNKDKVAADKKAKLGKNV